MFNGGKHEHGGINDDVNYQKANTNSFYNNDMGVRDRFSKVNS